MGKKDGELRMPKMTYKDFCIKQGFKPKVYSGADVKKATEVKNWVRTGIFPLDLMLGDKGLPSGRFVFLSADSGQGKSLLGMEILQAFQAQPGVGHLIESERGFDPSWAETLRWRWDMNQIHHSPSLNFEQTLDYIINAIKYQKMYQKVAPTCIYWDSLTMSTPSAALARALKGDYAKMGRDFSPKALISKDMCPIISDLIADTMCTLVIVSQLRKDPNVQYGDDGHMPGGKIWEYKADLNLRLRIVPQSMFYPYESAKKGDKVHEPLGYWIEVKVIKSRIGPFQERKVFLPVLFREYRGLNPGIDNDWSMFGWLKDRNLIQKYSGRDDKLQKAKALQIRFDKEIQPFVGVDGWRVLLAQAGIREAVQIVMRNNVHTRGMKDADKPIVVPGQDMDASAALQAILSQQGTHAILDSIENSKEDLDSPIEED